MGRACLDLFEPVVYLEEKEVLWFGARRLLKRGGCGCAVGS
jgi:hypothetical protein